MRKKGKEDEVEERGKGVEERQADIQTQKETDRQKLSFPLWTT